MNVQITEEYTNAHGATIGATCEKVQGVVSIGAHTVQVLCINAAHKAWRGGGRCFRTIPQALEAYKSPEMRAIIRAAAERAPMWQLPVRKVSIRCKDHPEWGTWGVYEERGGQYEIHGSQAGGGRVLDKAEAAEHWELANPADWAAVMFPPQN